MACKVSWNNVGRLRCSALVLTLALIGGAAVAHDPPGTSTGRSCDVWWQFTPTFRDGTEVKISFSAHGHAPVFAHNLARVAAANVAWQCATEHWESQLQTPPPEVCDEEPHDSMRDFVVGYPMVPDLHSEVTRRLCAANPGRDSVNTDIHFHIAGHEGCTRYHPWDTQIWVSGYRFDCPPSGSGSGGGGAPAPAPPPPPSPPSDPATPSDAAPPPPPSPPSDPEDPTALFRIFTNVRLPGHDIGTVDIADGDWQACARVCAGMAGCHAWTYRDVYRGVSSVCLLKSAAGLPIPDPCCRSGIER
ncbi:MAG: hypothetical protein COW55_10380 [Rhodobacteraceae bacterium CG17_big_fil_post_rev_8_21_14_2_50_65_11]|nr:MAG: hypothetical protein COW55_10380 [Rhodobacteraceae bacterium CG17_big_fil_post_rev_8_21_14_2_50_65_11]